MNEPRVLTRPGAVNRHPASWRTIRTHPDLICLSHLRWGFVFQRPQHLMTRFARDRRVFFVEEPIRDGDRACLSTRLDSSGVFVVEPHVPASLTDAEMCRALQTLLEQLLAAADITDYVLWI